MANLNKVMLIGRLTRDPEVRAFSNGGKVAKFGFAVNNKKKNQQTGQWEDDPVFIDVEVFNRGENGRQADLVEQSLRKGHQVFLEGHLKLDRWTDKDGQNRSKLGVVCDNFQFLERREGGPGGGMGDGMSEGGGSRFQRNAAPARSQPARSPSNYDESPPEPDYMDGGSNKTEEEIPF